MKFKKCHNRKLYDLTAHELFFGFVRGRRMRWVFHMAYIEEERNVYRLFVGKPEVMLPFGRLGIGEKMQLI